MEQNNVSLAYFFYDADNIFYGHDIVTDNHHHIIFLSDGNATFPCAAKSKITAIMNGFNLGNARRKPIHNFARRIGASIVYKDNFKI